MPRLSEILQDSEVTEFVGGSVSLFHHEPGAEVFVLF